jgi:CRISPR/Cas system-associated endoribonuclease Cas2
MKRAALILFVFNRPDHAKLTLEALVKNDLANETDFYIFCDGPRNEKEKEKTAAVRDLVDSYADKGFFKSNSVFKSEVNKGLARSVIDGVTKVFEEHDRVIVIEDDLIASEDFLSYMNEALNFYEGTNAGSVTGYNPLKIDPNRYKKRSYAVVRSCSFGWGTWKAIWKDIDWDLKDYNKYRKNFFQRRRFNATGMDRTIRLDRQMKRNVQSWSVRFGYNLFQQGKVTYYPSSSKITPNGWDGSGTHSSSYTSRFNVETRPCYIDKFEVQEVNKSITKRFQKLYGRGVNKQVKEFLFFVKNVFR